MQFSEKMKLAHIKEGLQDGLQFFRFILINDIQGFMLHRALLNNIFNWWVDLKQSKLCPFTVGLWKQIVTFKAHLKAKPLCASKVLKVA